MGTVRGGMRTVQDSEGTGVPWVGGAGRDGEGVGRDGDD